MGKYQKLIEIIKDGDSDAHIHFDDLCHLMTKLGFDERVRGSHHIFRKSGVTKQTNLQRDSDKAKGLSSSPGSRSYLKYRLRISENV